MTNGVLETTAIPIQDAFQRLGIGRTNGTGLVNSGELKTFMIGVRRYTTEAELFRLIRKRMQVATKESAADRSAKVAAALASPLHGPKGHKKHRAVAKEAA